MCVCIKLKFQTYEQCYNFAEIHFGVAELTGKTYNYRFRCYMSWTCLHNLQTAIRAIMLLQLLNSTYGQSFNYVLPMRTAAINAIGNDENLMAKVRVASSFG